MDKLPIAIYPMKAADDDERVKKAWDDPNWWAERKYDGARYLFTIGADGNIKVTSRQESKTTGKPVEKTENVPHLVKHFMQINGGTIIDGEMITHENCTSSDVTQIMGAKPDKAIARQKERGWIKYVVYDILFYNGVNLCDQTYAVRRALLESIVEKYPSEYVMLSTVYKTDKYKHYQEIVRGGGEGVILKNIYAIYEPDKRPLDAWLKVKKFLTTDVVIMGYEPPTFEYTGKEVKSQNGTWSYWAIPTKDEHVRHLDNSANNVQTNLNKGWTPVTQFWFNDWIGSIKFGQYKDGVLVPVGDTSGMNHEVRKDVTDNQAAYIGRVMQVTAMERIKKTNALRHPAFEFFRDDKNAEDCVLGEC